MTAKEKIQERLKNTLTRLDTIEESDRGEMVRVAQDVWGVVDDAVVAFRNKLHPLPDAHIKEVAQLLEKGEPGKRDELYDETRKFIDQFAKVMSVRETGIGEAQEALNIARRVHDQMSDKSPLKDALHGAIVKMENGLDGYVNSPVLQEALVIAQDIYGKMPSKSQKALRLKCNLQNAIIWLEEGIEKTIKG
jgi:hypothetical protein